MFRVLTYIAAFFLAVLCLVMLFGGYILWEINRGLPDYSKLANYEPPIMTRVYSSDGELLAEYARERRLYVPINLIPRRVIEAFLAAEDKHFYTHGGVDATGIARAMVENVFNIINDRRLIGASTITQQVARNFLLTSDRTLQRKMKEALLALRLEKAYTKDKILELYLNEIYLGFGNYGIAAAAQSYFDVSLDKLTTAQAAYLAALPKAPSNYNPYTQRERALGRRNWVIERMDDNGFISGDEAEQAINDPFLIAPRKAGVKLTDAAYFVEEVRRVLIGRYGGDKLYEGGLSVRTTIDAGLQLIARQSMRKGLVEYDQRHGWRGPLAHLEPGQNWQEALHKQRYAEDTAPWTIGTVLELKADKAKIGLLPERLPDGKYVTDVKVGYIPLEEMKWARKALDGYLGPEVAKASDVLAVGDVVYVEAVLEKGATKHYALRQVPAVNGAVIALDPNTGRVLAMQGGFSFDQSEFNRAVQAMRQPGSSFKPFVYTAALDNGFTPSSLVLDAPFVMDQGAGLGLWRPENYDKDFRGPSTLRFGIEKSRNVMTVRLAQAVGMKKIGELSERLGIYDKMPRVLSMSLGAGETTLMRLAGGYAVLDNGGFKVTPALIDRVQDRAGRTIFKHDARPCPDCNADWKEQEPPVLPEIREQVLSPQTAYQMTSMLEGVIQRGTGQVIKSVGVPLAGKTGTSNEERDVWFVGYSPDLVVGVMVGYDQPTPLGRAETGGRTAAPIFRDIMQRAIGAEPAIPFRIPPGINLVKVNPRTGRLASSSEPGFILEAFKEGTEPQYDTGSSTMSVITGTSYSDSPASGATAPSAPDATISSGTGGLY